MEELQKELHDLTIAVRKSNSLWRGILRALLTGIAGALGAWLVTAVIIAILSNTIHSVRDVPIIGRIIQNTHLEQVFQPNTQK